LLSSFIGLLRYLGSTVVAHPVSVPATDGFGEAGRTIPLHSAARARRRLRTPAAQQQQILYGKKGVANPLYPHET
jgi:hypothetical protein